MRAQMYTMKTRGNEPTFSENERKCAATGCAARFVWDLVGNPEDRFSHNEAHFILLSLYLIELITIKRRVCNKLRIFNDCKNDNFQMKHF